MRSLEREEDLDGKKWKKKKKNACIKYCIEVVEETAFNGKGKKK